MKKRIVAFALLTALSLMITSLASGLTETITGTTGVTVLLDGEELDYTYSDGTEPEPFLSNGVTYLPVRAISEVLGLDVSWDQDTMTVSLESGAEQTETEETNDENDLTAPENKEITYAESYAAVYDALSTAKSEARYYYDDVSVDATVDAVLEESGEIAYSEEASAADTGTYAGDESDDYSQTNVQVEGVDEGDIVKTDGDYIYMLRDYELVILKADGAETEVISTTEVGESNDVDEMPGYDYYYKSNSKCAYEMYVSGDRLVVLSNVYAYLSYETSAYEWYYKDQNYTCVDIYDISDPTAPELLSSLGQDGYDLDSRMLDGKVYVLTSYYVWDFEESDPITYIPCLYEDGDAVLMDTENIAIIPDITSYTYTVVAVYDLESAGIEDQLSILGGGDTVYMNADNLYIAETEYESWLSGTWAESVYTVEAYASGNVTYLTRVDLSDGLEIAATGAVPGYLDSQFSMDEYDGYLRLVTTESTSTWKTYTDEAYGFSNYEWGESVVGNSLYVLDEDLDVAGSVEGLAEDEYVYSARFDGDIAYFCTYRNTDPLFAVDLSDPENPTVLDALKISGFSDYLHSWTGDLLFGLGKETDEDTGWTEGLKLVMFDTSDPTDVTVADYTVLEDETWSVALYNHKAVLISQEKNLICFPAGDSFYIYGYDEAAGFVQKAVVDLSVSSYDARALYIGQYLYIVTEDSVAVLDLDGLCLIADLEVAYG